MLARYSEISVTPLQWTLRHIPKYFNLDKNTSFKTPSHFFVTLLGQSIKVFSHVPLLQVTVFFKALVLDSSHTSHKIPRQLLGFWYT